MIFAFLTIILYILICFICLFTWLWLKNKSDKGPKKIVIPKSFVCWVGFICGFMYCAGTVFSLLDNEELWVTICFAGILWLAIGMLYGWLGTIITYDKNGFTVGWLPWQRRCFCYRDLTSTKITNHSRIFFCGKRKITLDYILIDDYHFRDYVMRRYKETWGKSLPYNNAIPKWDIFKGNLESPEEMIFIDIMLLIITLAVPVWQTYEAFDNVTEDETIPMELQVNAYEIDDDTLILKSKQNEAAFELWKYEKYENVFTYIISAIQDEQKLIMNVTVLEEEHDDPIRYQIYNIVNSTGKTILSFDEVNQVSNKNSLLIALFTLIFFFVWLFICIASVIVARNPQKYSKRVQRMFFKDGYLKCDK